MLTGISMARTASMCWTWWEILANRASGYSYADDDPGRDIAGRHDLVLGNTDHVMGDEIAARVRDTVP